MTKYKYLAAVGLVVLLGACKHDRNNTTTQSSAVNAQGSIFARLFNASNDSEPSAVQPGDAGAVLDSTEPKPVM